MLQRDVRQNNRLFYFVLVALLCISITIGAVLVWILVNKPKAPPVVATTNNELFTFAAAGDFDNTLAFGDVLKQIKTSDVDFTLALGDLSYGRATEQEWCSKVHETLGDTYPFQLVFGNHDDTLGSDAGRFAACLPNRMPNMVGDYGSQYYFDYEDIARIIAITPDVSVNGQTNHYTSGSAQHKWLFDRIDEAQQQNLWVIVAMHKNCLTIGVKTCEIGQDLFSMLLQKRVDVVLQGHEHGYMRSKQLVTSTACPNITTGFSSECLASDSSDSYEKGLGSVLVISGTGGIEPREAQLNSPLAPYFVSVHAKNASPVHGPTIFTVTKNQLEAQLLDITGKTQDTFTIKR